MADFPIIDIADIDDPDSQVVIADKITEASRSWGFLLLKNHQIPADATTELFKLARHFFIDVPEEEKSPWSINDRYVGYNGSLSDAKKDDKASMWFPGLAGELTQNSEALPPFWRQHIEKIGAFEQVCHNLIIKLLVCFAIAMDLPDRNHFAKAHAGAAGTQNAFRMLCYPSRANEPSASTARMSAHSDSGSVTLLFQTCAGLEVESPTGDWVAAPYLPGHILVNLGDALAFWSGGRLKATKHRVTFAGVPHSVERFSMAYFGKAAPETVLQPVKSEDDDGEDMRKYQANGVVIEPGITVREYSRIIMESIYGAGTVQKTKPAQPEEVQVH